MPANLLSTDEAAERLGITRSTLYDWLAQSDSGEFMIRGQAETINYFQGGRRGQGRIKFEEREINRLLTRMKVQPKENKPRQLPKQKRKSDFQYIKVKPGRPDEL